MKFSIDKIFTLYVIIYIILGFLFYSFLDSLLITHFNEFYKYQDLNELKNNIYLEFFLLFSWFSITSLFLGKFLATKISFELERIGDFFENIQNKVFKKRLILEYSVEFIKLQTRISLVIDKLKRLNKKKQKLNAKLKLLNSGQDKLLGAISHELKNPLSSIIGYSQILLEELDEIENYSEIKYVEKILANSKRIDELINRLRLALQMERENFQLQNKLFYLDKSVLEVVNMIGGNFPSREIKIDIEQTQIYGDETLLKQLIVNLIENAIKYSEKDILIILKKDILKVIDFGIGIAQDEISKVTQKFYRSNRNTHSQSMGLGLTIVNWILKLHGLELEIKSEFGKGSTFQINFNKLRNNIIYT